jgi:hypothetical protein
MNHEYSVEVLYHFNCGVCKNWWSYATTPDITFMGVLNDLLKDLELPKGIDYFCPHCGADEIAEIKKLNE